jgi:peptidoglycan hydrolase-like protein with peptidoglycan-binding domain
MRVRLWRVAVIAVALVAVLAGCGQATVKNSAATRQKQSATKPAKSRSTVKHSKAPPAATSKQKNLPAALGWIRNLQRDLRTLRFYTGPVTGVYTAQTKAAVIRFQKTSHLVPDAMWGPKSQAALDKRLHRKPSTAKLPPTLGWVRNLQRDLRALHLYSGPVTGIFTPATKAAVIHFQKTSHLVPDGEWGPRSQAALDKRLRRYP